MAYSDLHGCSRLIRVNVMHEGAEHSIGEPDEAIFAIVEIRFVKTFRVHRILRDVVGRRNRSPCGTFEPGGVCHSSYVPCRWYFASLTIDKYRLLRVLLANRAGKKAHPLSP